MILYFQDGISGWLSDEMTREGIEIDQMDVSGNTPLHLAARSGNTKTASTLLNLGASVNMKVYVIQDSKLFWRIYIKLHKMPKTLPKDLRTFLRTLRGNILRMR